MGAIATGGVRVLNTQSSTLGAVAEAIERVGRRERASSSAASDAYRGDRAPPSSRGRTVIVVDDGLATGSTMRAAVQALRQRRPGPGRRRRAGRRRRTSARQLRAGRRRGRLPCATPEPLPGGRRLVRGLLADDRRRGARSCCAGAPPHRLPGRECPRAPAALARRALRALTGTESADYALLELVGDARFVLIGEASHGTHEFYRERAPDHAAADRRDGLHRGRRRGRLARRLPRQPVRARRRATTRRRAGARADFQPLPRVDVAQRRRARVRRRGCARTTTRVAPGATGRLLRARPLQPARVDRGGRRLPRARRPRRGASARASATPASTTFGGEPQAYGYAAGVRRRASRARTRSSRSSSSCSAASRSYSARDGWLRRGRVLRAEQNARRRHDAEQYYRSMFRGRVASWNLRDTHMADTLDALRRPPRPRPADAKVVVWAHNSHLGDARATEIGRARRAQRRPARPRAPRRRRLLVGFTTYDRHGHRRRRLGRPAERKRVRPGAARQLRGAVPRDRARGRSAAAGRARTERHRRADAAAARARDRRDLPTRDRAAEPLLPRPARATSSTW